MLSINQNIFYGRIYHDEREKSSVYEGKSDSRRKVVIVRRTLIRNFIIRIAFSKFCYMLYYCNSTMDLYIKSLLNY